LYYRAIDAVLLKCLGEEEAKKHNGRDSRESFWSSSIGIQDEVDDQKQ
jgi:hypothetical protein